MSDFSPAKQVRGLGLDRRETGYFHPTAEFGIATAIERSTAGTLRSDVREMRRAEKLRCQSCLVLDYD